MAETQEPETEAESEDEFEYIPQVSAHPETHIEGQITEAVLAIDTFITLAPQ